MGVVPVLTDVRPGIQLDEAHAALHQTSSQQAFAAKIVCRGFANAIEFLGGVALFGKVHGIWRGTLHPERQLVGCDPRLQLRAVRMAVQMLLIQLRDQVERFGWAFGVIPFGDARFSTG